MGHSGQGILKDDKAEEQPADKQRAQTVHQTGPDGSVSREATRDPEQSEAEKARGSGSRTGHRGGQAKPR